MSDKCDSALAELYEYLDAEIDAEARERIEQHLKDCSPCLEAFDFMDQLRRTIADRCRDQVPAGLRERVRAAIESCEPDGVA